MWFLAACGLLGGGRPDGVPADALHVVQRGTAFELMTVDESVRATVSWDAIDRDPVEVSAPDLVNALEGAPALWLELPADTPWYRVRQLLGSAVAAGVEPVLLSVEELSEPVVVAGREPEIGLRMSCSKGPLAWSGVQPRITLALQSSREGTWAVAHARFLPVIDEVPTDGLSSDCLAPQRCSGLFDGDAGLVAACEAGRGEPVEGRVDLGGPVGCLLPFLDRPDELSQWEEELPAVLQQLELRGDEPVLVAPEARIRWDVVVATLRGFQRAGLPVPALGKPLIEGNDGPPTCGAEVRSGRALREAGARHSGSLMGATRPAEEE